MTWALSGPPTLRRRNAKIDQDDRGYGRWRLAIDTEASEEAKSRYGFPYGGYSKPTERR